MFGTWWDLTGALSTGVITQDDFDAFERTLDAIRGLPTARGR